MTSTTAGPTRRVGLALLAAGLLSGCGTTAVATPEGTAPVAEAFEAQASEPEASKAPRVEPSTVASPSADEPASSSTPSPLLQAASGGDGDSWRDAGGREYRLGLVNTPETDECFGSEATLRRKELTSSGFRAEVYETDRYGRSVADVTTSDGLRLNVYLARYGFADDRFLEEFRGENPALAAELDAAFAAARAEGRGLWSSCGRPAAPVPPPVALVAPPPAAATAPEAGSSCHPDYLTCVPVKGTGSGEGEVNDLDCGDVGFLVEVRQRGVDPYRLDGNADGFGCEG